MSLCRSLNNERHGSILAFLRQYLSEINEYGYSASPMEQEAIVFAEKLFPNPMGA